MGHLFEEEDMAMMGQEEDMGVMCQKETESSHGQEIGQQDAVVVKQKKSLFTMFCDFIIGNRHQLIYRNW